MAFYGLLVSIAVFCVWGVRSDPKDKWDLWWQYKGGFSGPSAWGGYNQQWKLCSIGKKQSPVDVIPDQLLYDANLKHLVIDKHRVHGELKNTGHDLTIYLDTSEHEIYMHEGPFAYKYKASKIVVHFGSNDKQGSEHRIAGKAFPVEVQLYGYNSQLYDNMTTAEESHSGVAAVTLMVAVSENSTSALGDLINQVPHVQYKGSTKALAKFSVHELLPETHNYITYEGSMTKPGCYESVTWAIMNKPVYITANQLKLLRQTVSTGKDDRAKQPLANNYRPVQSFNRRALRTNINFPHQKSAACDIKREKSYTANVKLLSPKDSADQK